MIAAVPVPVAYHVAASFLGAPALRPGQAGLQCQIEDRNTECEFYNGARAHLAIRMWRRAGRVFVCWGDPDAHTLFPFGED